MKRGFTLIELLAVIALIALIAIIALPSIMSQITKSKGDVTWAANDTMVNAAELYLDGNVNLQAYKEDTTFCITLEVLVNEGNLKEPIKNLDTGKNMDLKTNAIQVTYDVSSHLIKDGKVGLLSNLSCQKTVQ